MSVDVVMAARKWHAAEVMARVEDGRLPWAFNIASEIHTRCEVRILSQCLADLETGKQSTENLDFEAVLKLIFPAVKPTLPGVIAKVTVDSISRQFGVRSYHVMNLVHAGWLRLVPGSKPRLGPGGSAFVLFSSVSEFLRRRRIT